MSRPRTLLALLATQLLALGALAQSDAAAPSGIEFGRASSGTIQAIAKAPRQLSGSLSISQSTGGRGQGYGGTLGGELLDDRLWFFGAATILPATRFANAHIPALEAKAEAQPVDWTAVTASFSRLQQPLAPFDAALPSTFLSLRSTSLLSERTMLSISYSSSRH